MMREEGKTLCLAPSVGETSGQIEWASMNQFVRGNRCPQQQPIGLNPMRLHKMDKLRLPLKRRSNVTDWLEYRFRLQ